MIIGFALHDTIEALNAGLFVSPGFGTHPERVLDSYELIFVTQGHLDMFEGTRTFSLSRNQSLLLFPGRRHGGLRPYEADLNFYWIHFRVRETAAARSVNVPQTATVRDPDVLTELFCRFISDQESAVLDTTSASQLVSVMLCSIAKETPPEADGTAGSPTDADERSVLARRVQEYIDGHASETVSTSTIAAELRYNADYLERVFRAHAHVSILAALHQKRIAMARTLLHAEPGKNINEIALECGYPDPAYFHRMFKRLTGLTPREFRTLYARTHINTH